MFAFVRSIPLRVKLVTAVLALVTAALLVISASSAYFLRGYLMDQVDNNLRAYNRAVSDNLDAGMRVELNPSYNVLYQANSRDIGDPQYNPRFVTGANLPKLPTDPATLVTRADTPFTVGSMSNGRMRWRVLVTKISSQDDYLVIALPLTDVDHTVGRLIWIDVLAGASVLILLALAGAAIVRSNLRPLRAIEQTAGAIAAGDLSQRVPDPEPGVEEPKSELGRLSRALNAMLTQIESAFAARAESEAAARDAAFAAQASEARARRSEERMRQFVADASHELRTPLTSIRGFAELYRQGAAAAPEDTARLVRRIEDEAARMGLLVEDLLLLARLDRERPVTLAPVELPVLAAEAVQAAQATAPDREIALEVDRTGGPLVVRGDDARLRQVLGNLLSNALTHTPADARVAVRLRSEDDSAVVEVADSGPGLSPQQSERVFERFYRGDAARTRHDGSASTGLGLAIVAALVAAHDGTVRVEETPGGGATFQVRLPLTHETDESDDETDSQAIPRPVPGGLQSGTEGLQA